MLVKYHQVKAADVIMYKSCNLCEHFMVDYNAFHTAKHQRGFPHIHIYISIFVLYYQIIIANCDKSIETSVVVLIIIRHLLNTYSA